jgi:predicted nucleic acid-binding protein
MRYYIDASAAAKLLRIDDESTALQSFLNGLADDDEILSSLLLETELRRIAVREFLPQLDVTKLLTGISLVHPERDFFHAAGLLGDGHLRTLDALHVITAVMAEARFFLAYDVRLTRAAAEHGFTVISPN